MNPLMSGLKFLDQPALYQSLSQKAPWLLSATALAATASEVSQAPPEQRKKRAIQLGITYATTIAAGVFAFRKFMPPSYKNMGEAVTLVRESLSKLGQTLSPELHGILDKAAQNRILMPSQVHALRKGLSGELFDMIIDPPKNVSAHEIIEEIGALSAVGFAPVFGGILGGALGKAVTDEDWKQSLPNQVKEGIYQFLANIVLCNVGAYFALKGLEALPKSMAHIAKSSTARLSAMSVGILAVGVLGGSSIANFLGKNLINPMIDHGPLKGLAALGNQLKTQGISSLFRDLNKERHPEAKDVMLHVDDFATIGFLSGLRWIGALLMFLYTFSGKRAAEGYRNGDSPDPLKAPSGKRAAEGYRNGDSPDPLKAKNSHQAGSETQKAADTQPPLPSLTPLSELPIHYPYQANSYTGPRIHPVSYRYFLAQA